MPGSGRGLRLLLIAGAAVGLTLLLAAGIGLQEFRILIPIASVALLALSIAVYRSGTLGIHALLGIAVAVRLILFPLPPEISDDVYRYIWDGLLQAHGINPYAFIPSDPALAALHDEPIFALLNSKAYYSVYPPASQIVFAVGALAYDAGWEASYYLIKALLVGAELAALLLVSRISPANLLALYALNPVILIEAAAQPHTENLLLLALAVMFWAVVRRRPTLAVLAATLGAWVKLYPFLLLPFLLRRVGWRFIGLVSVVSLVLSVPYLRMDTVSNVLTSLNLYVSNFEFNAGPYYLLKWAMNEWQVGGRTGWGRTIGPIFRFVFLLAVPLLYAADIRFRWRLPSVVLVLFGSYLFLATTIHPWYFLGILLTIPLLDGRPWNWIWLSTTLTGTYLFYTVGWYWPFIWIGWIGWLVLSLRPSILQAGLASVLRDRARQKNALIAPLFGGSLSGKSVLDLGAGDGYVGEDLARRFGADVHLMDVVDFNRTGLPMQTYDGSELPFPDRSFDVVLLVFVLHHCKDSETTLKESLRVARERVVVLESVYERAFDHRLLRFLDRVANRLRSGGLMRTQEGDLTFRRAEEWVALFERHGAQMCGTVRKGRWVHRQFGMSVRPADTTRPAVQC